MSELRVVAQSELIDSIGTIAHERLRQLFTARRQLVSLREQRSRLLEDACEPKQSLQPLPVDTKGSDTADRNRHALDDNYQQTLDAYATGWHDPVALLTAVAIADTFDWLASQLQLSESYPFYNNSEKTGTLINMYN